MEPTYRKVLQENWDFLVENIYPGDLLAHLISKNVITSDQHEEITCEATVAKKVRAMLNVIVRRSETFPLFCEALRESDQGHVAAKLEHSLESMGMEVDINPAAGQGISYKKTAVETTYHNIGADALPMNINGNFLEFDLSENSPKMYTDSSAVNRHSHASSKLIDSSKTRSHSSPITSRGSELLVEDTSQRRSHSTLGFESRSDYEGARFAQTKALNYFKTKSRESLSKADVSVTKGPPTSDISFDSGMQFDQKRTEIEELKKSVIEKDRLVTESQSLIKSYEVDNQRKTQEINLLKDENTKLRKAESEKQSENFMLKAEIDKLNESLGTTVKELKLSKGTVQSLMEDKKSIRREIEDLKKVNAQIGLENKKLVKRLEKASEELKSQQEKLDLFASFKGDTNGHGHGIGPSELLNILHLVQERSKEARALKATVEKQGEMMRQLMDSKQALPVRLNGASLSDSATPELRPPTQCTDLYQYANEEIRSKKSLADHDTWKERGLPSEDCDTLTDHDASSVSLMSSTSAKTTTDIDSLNRFDGRESEIKGARPKSSPFEKQPIGIASPMRREAGALNTMPKHVEAGLPNVRSKTLGSNSGSLSEDGISSSPLPLYHEVSQFNNMKSTLGRTEPTRQLNFERNIGPSPSINGLKEGRGNSPLELLNPASPSKHPVGLNSEILTYKKENKSTDHNIYQDSTRSKSPAKIQNQPVIKSPHSVRTSEKRRPVESGDGVVEPQVCPLCNMEFSPPLLMKEFEEHVNDCLGSEGQFSEEERVCPVCEASFNSQISQQDFEIHVQNHFEVEMSELQQTAGLLVFIGPLFV